MVQCSTELLLLYGWEYHEVVPGQQRGQSAQQQAAQEDIKQGSEGGGRQARTQNVELWFI